MQKLYLNNDANDFLAKLEESFYKEKLELKTECLKENVVIRIESLKADLDGFEQELIFEIDSFSLKHNFKLKLLQKLQRQKHSRGLLKIDTYKNFLTREYIGNVFKTPRFESYKKTLNEEILHVRGKNLWKLASYKQSEQVIISDIGDYNLKVLDPKDGTILRTIDSTEITIYPWTINTDLQNEIIIGCLFERGIYVFDLDFKLKRIFGEDFFTQPTSIAVDNDNFIYISDCGKGILSKWTSSGVLVKQVDTNRPGQMKIFEDRLYVISSTVFKVNESQQLSRITHGLNCILVYDRLSMLTIGIIKCNKWIEPRGLFFDENKNVCTAAYELDDDQNVQSSRKIFVFNRDFYLMNKINLKEVKKFNDLMYFNGKIWILLKNSIKIFQFYSF